jgi:general secretion pathway protein G
MIRKTVSRLRRSQGFTLIELLVALAILALIAGIAVPQVLKYLAGAKTDTAQIQIESLGGALDLYRLDVGRYPAEGEGLKALVERPLEAESWNGPYIKKAEGLIDPWGNPYIYDSPGEHGDYDLYSLGADGAEGGEDEDQDVVSW